MSKKFTLILGIVATLLTMIGSIWAFESHYATNKTVEKLEINIASALQNQQYKGDVRYFQFMMDKVMSDIFILKRQIERYPDDQMLRQDYQELLERRKQIKIQLEQALRNIKVG